MSAPNPRRYLDLFVAESREHLAGASRVVAGLGGPAGSEAVRQAFRHLHSVKGMAATMGFASMQDLAHAAEGVLDACRRGALDPERGGALVGEATACLERLLDRAARGEPDDGDPDGRSLAARLRAAAGTPGADPGGTARPVPAAASAAGRLWRVGLRLDRTLPFPALRAASVLGRLGRLGRVVASTPPAAQLRTGRCDGAIAATLESSLEAAALGAALARIDELESFTVAPMEPPPATAPEPTAAWARLPVATLDAWLADANDLVRSLARAGAPPRALALARRLRRRALDARLVPFESLAGRLERAAADIARGIGKEVDVDVSGRDTPLDRTLLDALADPLLHLVRNAVDHGLEPPPEREAAGKPRRGVVRIGVARRAARLEVVFEDDGRGVDLDAVRRRAGPEGADLDDASATALLLRPGFSTARREGSLSGRGVGLDVVAEAVRAHGGRLALDPRPGIGLRLRMSFPCAATRIHALVVRSGRARFAIPSAAVRRVVPHPSGGVGVELREDAGARTVRVDAVEGNQELLVRPLRGPLAERGTFAAAGVLDDGGPVLVLDPTDA